MDIKSLPMSVNFQAKVNTDNPFLPTLSTSKLLLKSL